MASRRLLDCRKSWIRWWWADGGELGGGVFGFPALSFSDGMEKQEGSGWDVGVVGCWSFPPVGPVLRAVAGLDASLSKELPNEFAAFSAVIIEGLVRPFPGDQHAAPSNTQMFHLVGFALALAGCHGVPGALGLDAIEKPDRAAG